MALTNEDLKQILEMFKAEGWRMSLPSENYEDVKDFRLDLGELCNLPNEKIIKIGNGIDTIEDLPFIEYSNKKINDDPSLAVIIQNIWDDIQRKTTILQKWTGIMPQQYLSLFMELAPPNFSFLRGEIIPEESPTARYWENAPNAEGVIFRNYHFENNTRDDVTRILGSYQEDAIQKMTGTLTGVQGLGTAHTNGVFSITGEGLNASKGSYYRTFTATLDSSRVVRTANENRPKNILTISVWRTY